MNMPGFNANAALYRSAHVYHGATDALPYGGSNAYRRGLSAAGVVVPAIPACANCDYILDNCAQNGWRPRAVCNACAFGNCYEEPPMPDPYPDPFDPLPRF